MSRCYIVSVKHSQKQHQYITFWRPDNAGYAWPLSWAGNYERDAVLQEQDYYNTGCDSIAVDADIVDALAIAPAKGTIDNDAGPVVLNVADNWRKIMAAVIAPPAHKPRPEAIYFGRNARHC